MKEYLESRLKLRCDDLKDVTTAKEPVCNGNEGLINELNVWNKSHVLDVALLSETTSIGYIRMKTMCNRECIFCNYPA